MKNKRVSERERESAFFYRRYRVTAHTQKKEYKEQKEYEKRRKMVMVFIYVFF